LSLEGKCRPSCVLFAPRPPSRQIDKDPGSGASCDCSFSCPGPGPWILEALNPWLLGCLDAGLQVRAAECCLWDCFSSCSTARAVKWRCCLACSWSSSSSCLPLPLPPFSVHVSRVLRACAQPARITITLVACPPSSTRLTADAPQKYPTWSSGIIKTTFYY